MLLSIIYIKRMDQENGNKLIEKEEENKRKYNNNNKKGVKSGILMSGTTLLCSVIGFIVIKCK